MRVFRKQIRDGSIDVGTYKVVLQCDGFLLHSFYLLTLGIVLNTEVEQIRLLGLSPFS